MRYLDLAGMRSSRIGLGTWQFGSREWGYGDAYLRETAPELLRRAAELGVTMIDTAEIYGPGRSETVIGATIAALPVALREQLVVATKFMPVAPHDAIVARQAAGSLRRLGVASLDLYYVHWPNPFVSPRRIAQSLRPLVHDGRVRRVGVSNHSLDAWRSVERSLGAPVVVNQVQFSLVRPQPLRDLVPYAAGADRAVVAYSPLAQGLLASDAPWTGRRDLRGLVAARRAASPAVAELRAAVGETAVANDATPAQVALAWVLAHPNTIAIPGARTLEQLERNAAAADLVLAADEVARLTAAAEAAAYGREGSGA